MWDIPGSNPGQETRYTGVSTKLRTEHLPVTNSERYRFAKRVWSKIIYLFIYLFI
jgi:hypothetical protein